MSAPRLELDFAGRRLRGGMAGLAAALVGVVLLALAIAQHLSLGERLAGLELRRTALERAGAHVQAPVTIAGLDAQHADKTVTVLAAPWSQLLAELESAGTDSSGNVALLSVEPDHVKHRVKVTAEARTLQLALAYVERLHKAGSLRYPMLESHETRKDDPQHPVRFQLSAEWSDAS